MRTSSPPASSPGPSTARSCSCTREIDTCSPTTACPTTTKVRRRCSSNACWASSTPSSRRDGLRALEERRAAGHQVAVQHLLDLVADAVGHLEHEHGVLPGVLVELLR